MEEKIRTLFKQYNGNEARRVEPLPVSGSARRYYRVFTEDRTYVGVYHENLRENRLFVDFTRHFEKSRLHVPHVYLFRRTGFVICRMIWGRICCWMSWNGSGRGNF